MDPKVRLQGYWAGGVIGVTINTVILKFKDSITIFGPAKAQNCETL